MLYLKKFAGGDANRGMGEEGDAGPTVGCLGSGCAMMPGKRLKQRFLNSILSFYTFPSLHRTSFQTALPGKGRSFGDLEDRPAERVRGCDDGCRQYKRTWMALTWPMSPVHGPLSPLNPHLIHPLFPYTLYPYPLSPCRTLPRMEDVSWPQEPFKTKFSVCTFRFELQFTETMSGAFSHSCSVTLCDPL